MSSVKKTKSAEKNDPPTHSPERYDKRVQLAIPLRVVTWDAQKRPQLDMVCTLDVSLRGARLYGVRPTMKVGEVVTVERGRNKFFCRVVWIGEPNTEQKGQIGIQAVDAGKSLWEKEMRDVADQFSPIQAEEARPTAGERKRKFQRLQADAQARVLPQSPGMPDGELSQGRIKNISETGCLLTSAANLEIGACVQIVVDLPNSDVAVRGKVRHIGPDGLGIQFSEIRKSDRQLLRYWLRTIGSSVKEVTAGVS
jgi:hypothetical protein